LNLGLRYDFQNKIGTELNLRRSCRRHQNDTNTSPAAGIRVPSTTGPSCAARYDRFFAQGTQDEAHQTILYQIGASPLIGPTGGRTFPATRFSARRRAFSSVLANSCDLNGNRAGCIIRQFVPEINSPLLGDAVRHQASIGVQRQIGTVMSFESNVVYTGGRNEGFDPNINLAYDPTTGVNYNSNDATRRPLSQFGPVQMSLYNGRSNYYGWENAFTRRMSNHFQASITYTLSQFKDATHEPWLWSIVDGHLTRKDLGFKVADDMGGQYGLAATDQRHRVVFNGILEAPLGFQVSGVYFYGSGLRFGTTYGGDPEPSQPAARTAFARRPRPKGAAGTIVARNDWVK
jgi:hypothetical protein